MEEVSVNSLIKAREESANVPYQTFIRYSTYDPEGVFCHFEGNDDPGYYDERIRNIIKKNVHYIICNKKSMVLKVYELIKGHREYDKYSNAYFVDKDFDATIIGKYNGEIYETPCYSIENLYVSERTLSKILKSEFRIQEPEDDYLFCINTYNNLQLEFHNAVTLINAWYNCLKDKRNVSGTVIKASLNDTLPKNFVAISLDLVSCNYTQIDLESLYPDAEKVSQVELQQKIEIYNLSEKHLIFRGKYEIEFFKKFVSLLSEDANKLSPLYLKKKYKNSISFNNIISSFSKYADSPECLINYLNKFVD